MKKHLVFPMIFLAFLFLSCSNRNESTDKMSARSEDTNINKEEEKFKANTPAVFKAIETGNFDGVDSLWADNIVDHSGPNGKEVRGKDSIKAELQKMHNSIKDLKFDVVANAYDNGYLMTLAHVTGTTTTAFMGMPANTKMDSYGVGVVKMTNGKVTDHWHYANPNEMMMNSPNKTKK
jgi:steroid delta-isomerase-like uncharacterized protein